MAWHLYLVPIVLDSLGTRAPKYLKDLGVPRAMAPYGFQDVGFAAADVDNATDTSLQTNADLDKIPDNLDNTLGAQTATVQARLELKNLPSDWVTSGMTYRFVVRKVLNLMQFCTRYAFVNNTVEKLMSGSVDLDTQFQDLPLAIRQRLLGAAESFNFDTSGLSGTSTIRQILKNIADQYGDNSYRIGGIVI